ncbi:SDR family oxidoreductase [Agarivorans aestuarii]|uniref:SDR family oxidoreductase n=1 Tax=Agarivorans aestuarii TaxID=1563703 RepID=A0ABU7G4R1_9ALTE|nr:SDR family oxidoreductase [Agarivorans aestuarii]MEE1674295.1 SDR family oxidoreductase [Agarivorans aestuarii]
MQNTKHFLGKSALIMGASRGIGLATAQVLAGLGVKVVLAARHEQEVEKQARLIKQQGAIADAIGCDVSQYSSVLNAVDYCLTLHGQIDLLINNAGVIEPLTTLVESDPQLWGLAADINYKGVYHGMRAVLPEMIKAKSGVIVNLSSGAANSALFGWSHYCSSKAASQKLTEVAQLEVAEHNIRIVGLSPGTVATDMMASIRDSQINAVSKLDWNSHIPAEWAAKAVAYLCGPEGQQYVGSDFSLKSEQAKRLVGLID